MTSTAIGAASNSVSSTRIAWASKHRMRLPNADCNLTYSQALNETNDAISQLPEPAAQYLLPFASRSRFLFKMDFAELEYISRLRSGVKGHFAYRKIAWEMKLALEKVDPALSALIDATPPWVEDPLKR